MPRIAGQDDISLGAHITSRWSSEWLGQAGHRRSEGMLSRTPDKKFFAELWEPYHLDSKHGAGGCPVCARVISDVYRVPWRKNTTNLLFHPGVDGVRE